MTKEQKEKYKQYEKNLYGTIEKMVSKGKININSPDFDMKSHLNATSQLKKKYKKFLTSQK